MSDQATIIKCMYCGDKDCGECSNGCGRLICYDCAKNSKDNHPICRTCKKKEEEAERNGNTS